MTQMLKSHLVIDAIGTGLRRVVLNRQNGRMASPTADILTKLPPQVFFLASVAKNLSDA